MHFTFRNVNDAFRRMVHIFHDPNQGYGSVIQRSSSRVGDVLYIQEPCTITYTHPRERVLFNQARDANPFFHLYESLWMLAGRNNIAPLNYYSSGYAKQVQDGDSPIANGAYGYRWRHSKKWVPQQSEHPDGSEAHWSQNVDQLKILIDQLKHKPDSRRCVLQMWNVEDDLLKIDTTKDTCCNLCAKFSLRPASQEEIETHAHNGYVLNMTVYNRSNDLIWGTLGANAVHFSFLQEYVAACIGCGVGVYNQISDDQHVYVDRFEPEKWLADETVNFYGDLRPSDINIVPLVKDPVTFDREVVEFVDLHGHNCVANEEPEVEFSEPFLQNVAHPMCIAFHHHKLRDYDAALEYANDVEADDWCIAATNWLQKRKANYDAKTSVE